MALKEQMELFDDGGLMDEGGTIDPVSGNDVPSGSTQKEVRDDIPAQLSEGEFVFPADVVRYIGLEKLMQMRQQAKMGLQTMDDMGQMGNSEEAVIPDNLPFELSDLDMDDDPVEMNTGGVAGVSTVPSQVPATSFVQAPPPVTTMPIPSTPTSAPVPIAPTYTAPTQQEVPTFTPEQMQNVSFPGVVQTPESAPQLVEIVNPTTGERRSITYIPGVTTLPEGFVMASEYTAPETTAVTPTVGQAQVRKDDDDDPSKPDPLKQKLIADRIEAAKRMGFTDFLNPLTELASVFTPFGLGKGLLKEGQVTGTGYVVGKDNQLFDPASGKVVNQSLVDTAISFLKGESEDPGFSEEFFDIVPGPAGGQERKDRIAAQKAIADKNKQVMQKAKELGFSEREAQRKIEVQQQAKIKKEKEKIANVQKEAAKKLGGGKDKRSDLQKESDDYTARKVAKAISTGDYSGGFKEGGLASKKKSKPKKMRSGGLASKK